MTAAPTITHLERTTLSFDEIQKSALALHSNFHFRALTFTDIHMEFTRFKGRVLGLIKRRAVIKVHSRANRWNTTYYLLTTMKFHPTFP
jgi:hypothetical protein